MCVAHLAIIIMNNCIHCTGMHLHRDKRFPNKILKTGCVVDLIGSARYLKPYYIKQIFALETLIKNDDMSDFTAVITNTVHYKLKLLIRFVFL